MELNSSEEMMVPLPSRNPVAKQQSTKYIQCMCLYLFISLSMLYSSLYISYTYLYQFHLSTSYVFVFYYLSFRTHNKRDSGWIASVWTYSNYTYFNAVWKGMVRGGGREVYKNKGIVQGVKSGRGREKSHINTSVPPTPAVSTNNILFFFNSFESNHYNDILQPVLQVILLLLSLLLSLSSLIPLQISNYLLVEQRSSRVDLGLVVRIRQPVLPLHPRLR